MRLINEASKHERMPYSMISADLNGDGHPDLVVGYFDAPGVIYYNDGTGRNFEAHPFGDGKGSITRPARSEEEALLTGRFGLT